MKLRVAWMFFTQRGINYQEVESVEHGAKLIAEMRQEGGKQAQLEMHDGTNWVPWYDEGTGEDDPEVYLEMIRRFPDDNAYFNSGV